MSEIDLMLLPQTILQDLRYGARMLFRNAGFTTVAILALAIGIGVNTTAFTVYKAVFGRSLDAREPSTNGRICADSTIRRYANSMVQLSRLPGIPKNISIPSAALIALSNDRPHPLRSGRYQPPQFLRWHAGGKTGTASSSASDAEFASHHRGLRKLLFRPWSQRPARPHLRRMSPSELAASPSVLISENYWQKRFAGDPSILGKIIRLNGVPFTIIGITPHDFVGTSVAAPDFWFPLSLGPLIHPDDNWLRDRENQCCRLFARLAPGVTIGQAQAEMTAASPTISAHCTTLTPS